MSKERSIPVIALGCLLALVSRGDAVLASELKPDQTVVFFPSLARPTATNWLVQVHGWVFEPDDYKWLTPVLGRTLGINEKELTASEKAIFRERSKFFLEDNERRKTISILLAGNAYKVGPSGPNGHFTTELQLSSELILKTHSEQNRSVSNSVVPFEMLVRGQRLSAPGGGIHVLNETGISVISDIDDTIKISQVWDKKKLLRNTFCRPFQAVPGMAAVYQSWQKSNQAQFHYVSAMPWQLFVPISEFTHSNGFPEGTFHCRYFRVKDSSFWNLFRSPEKYKKETIERMVQEFPKRRFILVGDSGEKDPEVYAAIARRHPEQVARIFIRDLTGEGAGGARFRKAFSGLSQQVWKVFREPNEIAGGLE